MNVLVSRFVTFTTRTMDASAQLKRLKLDVDMDIRYLVKEDIVAIVKEVIRLKNMKSQVDDIDHLSNRRVRTVGEQLGQQFSIGQRRP